MPAGRPEEWTIEKSIVLANELVEWLQSDEKNIFWEKFIVIEKNMDSGYIRYLKHKFADRAAKLEAEQRETENPARALEIEQELKKLHEFPTVLKRAEKIQEIKLSEKAMDNRSVGGAIFILKNKHNWADKQEIKQESRNINVDAASLTAKSLEELLALQEEMSHD
jgi:hypothetical protein